MSVGIEPMQVEDDERAAPIYGTGSLHGLEARGLLPSNPTPPTLQPLTPLLTTVFGAIESCYRDYSSELS